MLTTVNTKNFFKLISVFILVGFFSCLIHITPAIAHNNTNYNTEHADDSVVCVDHEASVFGHSRYQNHTMIVAIIPSTIFSMDILANIDPTFKQFEKVYRPPEDTPLYIKNNIFLI